MDTKETLMKLKMLNGMIEDFLDQMDIDEVEGEDEDKEDCGKPEHKPGKKQDKED